MKKEVTLVFDIGKTNKKYFLFDEAYFALEHDFVQFPEVNDDDGFPCDNLPAITSWVAETFARINSDPRYRITRINFSAYGATMVHLGSEGLPCAPMYNYQKEFPLNSRIRFEEKHGDLEKWSRRTASPFLGMLNAGLQLFWLKYEKPLMFQQIHRSLFLPQYLSYTLSGIVSTEFTGIGCHTGLWDFEKNQLHEWVLTEGIDRLFPKMVSTYTNHRMKGGPEVGVGIHDSSSALVAYKKNMTEPFMLLSTGTWSICLNPFNYDPLTPAELKADCLCYLQPEGMQVKASRFFLGHFFSQWESRIAAFFQKAPEYHRKVEFNSEICEAISSSTPVFMDQNTSASLYNAYLSIDLDQFCSYEEAYHQLIHELVVLQAEKVSMVAGSGNINRIYVDGGFVSNGIFLHMLGRALPQFSIHPSEMALGSSLGAAIVVSQGLTSNPRKDHHF
jgi:sugar (pentulose or hexulose) kinase